MAFQRGGVWLVMYPYTDASTTKVRPALICSTEQYHAEQPDITVAALTSNVAAGTGTFDYVLRDWQAAGLRFNSAFKAVVTTLDPILTVHRIGAMTDLDPA